MSEKLAFKVYLVTQGGFLVKGSGLQHAGSRPDITPAPFIVESILIQVVMARFVCVGKQLHGTLRKGLRDRLPLESEPMYHVS